MKNFREIINYLINNFSFFPIKSINKIKNKKNKKDVYVKYQQHKR